MATMLTHFDRALSVNSRGIFQKCEKKVPKFNSHIFYLVICLQNAVRKQDTPVGWLDDFTCIVPKYGQKRYAMCEKKEHSGQGLS